MSGQPIQPGDTLILTHEDGGRLAIVHEVTPEGDIIERHTIPGQQKYVQSRPRSRFVRPKDPKAAHIAIGRMQQVAEERDAKIRAAKSEARKAFRSIYLDTEVDFEMEHD